MTKLIVLAAVVLVLCAMYRRRSKARPWQPMGNAGGAGPGQTGAGGPGPGM